MNKSSLKKYFSYKTPIYIFFFVFSLVFILPFALLVMISFTSEADLATYGYQLFPKHLSVMAYEFVLNSPETILNGYAVTAIYAIVCTTLTIAIEALMGYSLSRPFAYKKIIRIILIITMFFSGGIIPTYILRTQYLGLQNNIFVYLVPGVSAMTVFVFSSFFRSLPESLFESAKLDGASEMRCLVNIAIPLSLPILATYYLTTMLMCWNNYELTLYYVTDEKLYTLQYIMQNVLREAEMVKQIAESIPGAYVDQSILPPTETMKFAICVLAAAPMMIVFPFFQKFFSKGITVGSVKG